MSVSSYMLIHLLIVGTLKKTSVNIIIKLERTHYTIVIDPMASIIVSN